jgi:glycosyltransferase involved in cell wall biosynthesis
MFGWEFPPHISGGLGTACYGLTMGLAKHGLDIIFVVPKAYGDENEDSLKLLNASAVSLDYNDATYGEYWKRIEYMEIGSNIIPYVGTEDYSRIMSDKERTEAFTSNVFSKKYIFSGGYGPNLLEEVARYALVAGGLASTNEFDIIHAHDWLAYPAGIAAKKATGKPLVVHMHATEFDRSGESVNQPVYDIEREGMENADLVIAVSNMTRQIVIERYGIDPKKVVTVHNAVDHEVAQENLDIQKKLEDKVVTFLGRITFQKGPEYFVEAAYRVLQRLDNVRFVMAGSGDMMNQMVSRVAKLGIADKFHFTGFLKGNDVDKMFALSDAFVMPSVSEPFGIVPLEAMRSNVPVIISKQSGVAEVLQHAIKVDYWDIDAMADAIYGTCAYDGVSTMFKKHGKEEVESLKWEDSAKEVMDCYKTVLNR